MLALQQETRIKAGLSILATALIGLMIIAAAPVLPVLIPDGLGTLRIGMTAGQAKTVLGHKLDIDSAVEGCGQAGNVPIRNVGLLFEGEHLAWIEVDGPGVTARGIAVSANEQQVHAAFGKLVVEPHTISVTGHYLKIRTTRTTGYVFETERGRVSRFRAGIYPAVEYVEGCL